MATIFECKGVTKNFGGLTAVNQVCVAVKENEIFGIIGPNGSGKTTFFNLITGHLRPESGILSFKNKNIAGFKPHEICRAGIARTFQIARPFNNMTVLENTMIGALYANEDIKDIEDARRTAIEILRLCGLIEKKDLLAIQLNIADRKRLELCKALSTKPALLLLDEVMAGLNPTEVEMFMGLVREIRGQGVTILIVEHLMRAIMGISERVMVLNHGVKIAEGSPQEISKNKEVIETYLGQDYATGN